MKLLVRKYFSKWLWKRCDTVAPFDMESFLKELGNGFTYIDNEYKIKVGDRYNYIDLLLFNYIYNCFVVIELKIGELKKEHIGQIEVYMNYIDKNIKKSSHDKTIGIILVRKNNKYIIKYCSDERIKTREYITIWGDKHERR